MKHYTTTKGFCPHQISTKIGSINLYRFTHDIDFVCRRYHISKASLMRWNKIYDGTRESLIPKSHKPHSPHPTAHTEEELKWIKDYHRRTPNISICELYGKLREDKGYTRNTDFHLYIKPCIRRSYHLGLSQLERRSQNSKPGVNVAMTFKLRPVLIYHSRNLRILKNYATYTLSQLCK